MASNCDICGSRLEPEEYGIACQHCLRPIEEWKQEVDALAEANKLLYEALQWIKTYMDNQPFDQLAEFLIDEKVTEALAKAKQ